MLFDKLMLMMIAVVATTAVPITKNATDYDLSQFNQVHDQRQTGKGNFKLNIDGVAVMITTPEELLQSALLIAPALIEDIVPDYADLEAILNGGEKPEDLIRPEDTTSTSSTTSTTTTTESTIKSTTDSSTTAGSRSVKRRLKFPSFLRPFLVRLQ
ncbi:uncharacterized protein LOC109602552 isoform X1 [Aethina tumida]|uniref:uncharacterized protein LOC109602552 isoform X1 n=1 Tax=Aethina tumida TaxID=116153 RepID=UPI00214807FE|nr:uncharacterized protein LOC109602552 isoform X1 [Aethina tumida]